MGLAAVTLLAVAMLAWAAWGPGSSAGGGATGTPVPSSGAGLQAARLASVGGAASGVGTVPPQTAPFNPLDHVALPVFRATPQGDLLLDAQTRADVERIHGLYERDEALARLNEGADQLSPKAQRELRALYLQYVQYSQAVTQAFPAGQGGTSLDEAARQWSGLHDLRVQYFGAERAEAMFGEEEKTARELLALMRQAKEPGVSLEEKAAAAQEAWKKNQER